VNRAEELVREATNNLLFLKSDAAKVVLISEYLSTRSILKNYREQLDLERQRLASQNERIAESRKNLGLLRKAVQEARDLIESSRAVAQKSNILEFKCPSKKSNEK
jgi:hypothetical protein